jgi:cytoskeletal protein CcmA (bactofilin family)
MNAPARKETAVGEINTLLGRGSEFEGKLTFEGTVRIDGTLKGEVFSDDVLVVGEGAHLEAEVDIGEIIIQGSVKGNIRAKRSVEILAPGRVQGDITTPALQIDKGVIFEGRCHMDGIGESFKSQLPKPAAPKPAVAKPDAIAALRREKWTRQGRLDLAPTGFLRSTEWWSGCPENRVLTVRTVGVTRGATRPWAPLSPPIPKRFSWIQRCS